MSESSDRPTIAVIGGTGTLGSGLARRLAAAGYAVVLGSRDAAKAQAAAATLTASAGTAPPRGASNADAARAGSVILLAVPWSSQSAILEEIKPHTAGKIVIDSTVPLMPPKVARVQLPTEQSAALAAQAKLGPEARVVSAFHNVAAHKLASDASIDCDVLVFGDKAEDREVAIMLAKAAGLRGIHAGPLVNSVAAEALTSVLIGINRTYKVDGAGIRITGIGGER